MLRSLSSGPCLGIPHWSEWPTQPALCHLWGYGILLSFAAHWCVLLDTYFDVPAHRMPMICRGCKSLQHFQASSCLLSDEFRKQIGLQNLLCFVTLSHFRRSYLLLPTICTLQLLIYCYSSAALPQLSSDIWDPDFIFVISDALIK